MLLPQLWLLPFPVGNVYLWQDPDGLTLIDCGLPGSAPAIAAAIRELGNEPEQVRRLVLTHCHEDHVGSAAQVAAWGPAQVCAGAAVIRGAATVAPPILPGWEQQLWNDVHAMMPNEPVEPVEVDRELVDGDVLDFGGGARVLSVPGHTPGSIALLLPEFGVLFTGDTVARTPDGQVMVGVFNIDRARAVDSLRRQAELAVRIACFGHGDPVTDSAGDLLREAAARTPA